MSDITVKYKYKKFIKKKTDLLSEDPTGKKADHNKNAGVFSPVISFMKEKKLLTGETRGDIISSCQRKPHGFS